ncbi:hypothetical protein [Necropsobacter massiliensis]|uniref:hypothetical protein n=1 Tax=Necropsobacter massiliensis TaxID=1400001 RepID=UPI0005961A0C|nr:hypothetical protein [Necropsobacter massiliensis]
MKKIILTAIDDNNKLWYEHVIPFILSLKETDYNGDIGVISYGLSINKQNILLSNGLKIFPAANKYPEMLIDRQISAANIAEQYHYDLVALYDSDIWFPQKEFTVFKQIKDKTKLYCTYDIWECSFLYNCVAPFAADEVRYKINLLKKKNNYVYQAGVIVGFKDAWSDYKNYAYTEMQKEKFLQCYGIDSTIINLYAVDHGKIVFLPVKYNCPPAWGIRLNAGETGIEYTFENELVEGLHVTRAHRKGGEYSYHKLFSDKYYQQGQKFRIKHYIEYHITRNSLINFCQKEYTSPNIILLQEAKTCGCMNVSLEPSLYSENSLKIETSGSSSLLFKNTLSITQTIYFYAESIINIEPCDELFIAKNDEPRYKIESNKYLYITLEPGDNIAFLVRELDVDNKRIRWVFPNLKLI